MPLSWNEIKSRAASFMKEWENESSEEAEAKSFFFLYLSEDYKYIHRKMLATL